MNESQKGDGKKYKLFVDYKNHSLVAFLSNGRKVRIEGRPPSSSGSVDNLVSIIYLTMRKEDVNKEKSEKLKFMTHKIHLPFVTKKTAKGFMRASLEFAIYSAYEGKEDYKRYLKVAKIISQAIHKPFHRNLKNEDIEYKINELYSKYHPKTDIFY